MDNVQIDLGKDLKNTLIKLIENAQDNGKRGISQAELDVSHELINGEIKPKIHFKLKTYPR